jgi:hypothetical protein
MKNKRSFDLEAFLATGNGSGSVQRYKKTRSSSCRAIPVTGFFMFETANARSPSSLIEVRKLSLHFTIRASYAHANRLCDRDARSAMPTVSTPVATMSVLVATVMSMSVQAGFVQSLLDFVL